MRADVKVGMVLAFVVVVVATVYFSRRGGEEKPVALGQALTGAPQPGADDSSADTPAMRTPARSTPASGPRTASTEPLHGARTPRVQPGRVTLPGENTTAGSAQPESTPTRVAGPPSRQPSAGEPVGSGLPASATQPEPTPSPAGGITPPAGAIETATNPAPSTATGGPVITGPAHASPTTTPAATPASGTAQRPRSARSESKPTVETHRVQPGDSFASLAMAYFGSEAFTQYLMDFNPQITDPTALRVGALIAIPPSPPAGTVPGVSPAQPAPAATKKPAKEEPRVYVVQEGDSFYRIAEKVLGSAQRWEELFELNRELVGGDPKKLQIGQKLVLPKPADEKKPAEKKADKSKNAKP